MIADGALDGVLSPARDLIQQRRYGDAITWLSAHCGRQSDAHAERLLAFCRYQIYLEQPPRSTMDTGSAATIDPPEGDPFLGVDGVPEISASELDAARLAAGIRHHGALLVRGLLSDSKALHLAAGVRQSLDACEAWHAGGQGAFESPWYSRLPLEGGCEIAQARPWVESAGGVWLADSPHMFRELVELFHGSGIVDLIAKYFGERPMLSVGKSTLRCVPRTIREADWHQDGAFMGTAIRSVNVWLSLSHCGEDASGLEFLPRRMSQVLPTGSHGAHFGWSVGPGLVEEQGVATVSPVFAPGDALLFDHYFLHRTGIPTAIAKDRYAIESWFFAPSAYPADQVPLWL